MAVGKKCAIFWGVCHILGVHGKTRKERVHCFVRFCFLQLQSLGGEIPHYCIVLQLLTLDINKNKNPHTLSTILLTMCLLSGVFQFAGGQEI
jgi:hypothetical protein